MMLRLSYRIRNPVNNISAFTIQSSAPDFLKKSINCWRIRSCFCNGAMFITVSQDVISSAVFHWNIRNTRGAERMIFTLCWFFLIQGHSLWYSSLYFCAYLFFFCDVWRRCSVRRRHFVFHAMRVTHHRPYPNWQLRLRLQLLLRALLRAAYASMHADVLIKPKP